MRGWGRSAGYAASAVASGRQGGGWPWRRLADVVHEGCLSGGCGLTERGVVVDAAANLREGLDRWEEERTWPTPHRRCCHGCHQFR